MAKHKYYHVIENGRRNGEQVYIVVAVYQKWNAVQAFVERNGKPVWVVASDLADLGERVWGAFGHSCAEYWNSGAGWQVGVMPGLPLVTDPNERKRASGPKRMLAREED
jgi:hypothetical protein